MAIEPIVNASINQLIFQIEKRKYVLIKFSILCKIECYIFVKQTIGENLHFFTFGRIIKRLDWTNANLQDVNQSVVLGMELATIYVANYCSLMIET
jgi:hypothetical protein